MPQKLIGMIYDMDKLRWNTKGSLGRNRDFVLTRDGTFHTLTQIYLSKNIVVPGEYLKPQSERIPIGGFT